MLRSFSQDERGATTTEYVVVLSLVTVVAGIALVLVGPTLVRSFEWQVMVLGLPIP